MHLWLIVPMKTLAQSKSRLSPVLKAEERQQLSQHLLVQTLALAGEVAELAGILVISRDPGVHALALAAGAHVLQEQTAYNGESPDVLLNRALSAARQEAVAQGADALLVLPADLPLLTTTEIHTLVERGKQLNRGLVIAASRDGGTNALLLRPPDVLDFAYGPASYTRHVQQAHQAGLTVDVVDSPSLALDLDTPQDLQRWQSVCWQ